MWIHMIAGTGGMEICFKIATNRFVLDEVRVRLEEHYQLKAQGYDLVQVTIRVSSELGGHKTKKAAVSKALVEYIQDLEQKKMLSMFGTVEYDPEYDYKRQRRRS